MTPEQAGELVTYLIAAFPRDAIEDETFRVFLSDLALLENYEIGYQAVRELARGEDRFPTIRLVREAYQNVQRRRQTEHGRTHSLEQAKPGPIPEYVHVWWWARHSRDPRETRNLPQMVDPDTGLPLGRSEYLTQAEYEALADEWRAAGSPKLGAVADLVGSIRQD